MPFLGIVTVKAFLLPSNDERLNGTAPRILDVLPLLSSNQTCAAASIVIKQASIVTLMSGIHSSRPGVYSLMSRETPGLILPQHSMKREGKVLRVFTNSC